MQASLQQYSENTNSGNRGRYEKSKVEIDPATGEPMDEEWDGATYAERSIANKNKRKKVEQSAISERIGKWFPNLLNGCFFNQKICKVTYMVTNPVFEIGFSGPWNQAGSRKMGF